VHLVRGLAVGLIVLGVTTVTLFRVEPAAAGDGDPELSATLDGRPIPVGDVGRYTCDDFAYPEIRCWSSRILADSRALAVTVLTAVDYATIYDFTAYAGSYMHVSQDYSALNVIGWSDKISSFKGRNAETGIFYVDWFYQGTWYAFCCSTQVANLGVFSNTFSSMRRT
jgi:hypothetical protein